MPRAPGHDDGLGGAVARADDQVVGIEIELLDGDREQRQVLPIEPAREGQPLDRRSLDGAPLDQRRRRARQVDEGEQVRGGEHLAEDFEGLFAPAHAGEPVVNEGDAQPFDHTRG